MAVQTISYSNKSNINANSSIAVTNKVTDADMNEIKSVVNNNATETSTNTTKVSNLIGFVLWTNSNPGASISSDTNITLSSSDYEWYEIIFRPSTNSANTDQASTGKIQKGHGTRLQFSYSNVTASASGTTMIRDRQVTYVNATTLTIGYPIGNDTSASGVIPLYVIGYKSTPFV